MICDISKVRSIFMTDIIDMVIKGRDIIINNLQFLEETKL